MRACSAGVSTVRFDPRWRARRPSSPLASNRCLQSAIVRELHDLLADVGKQQVMADIQAWIDAHIGTEIPRSRRELRT
jgi:hypothetical protein